MKQSIKTTLMAIVALFAFSTVADAQFGLLKAAKKVVGKKKDPSQAYYDQLAKEKEAKEAKENEAKAKMWPVNNWITGTVVEVSNLWYENNPLSKKTILDEEQNWRDKAMKKNIIEQFLDDEKFNNKKREAGSLMKDRKVVAILFMDADWKIDRDKWDAITGRYAGINVVSELALGFTIVEEYNVSSKYQGAGAYSDTFQFDLRYFPGKTESYRHTVYRQFMLKDWEHDPNADPLKDL